MKTPFGLALAIVLSGAAGCRPYRAAPEPAREPRVFAHYMPWFRAEPQPDGRILWDHWQWFGKGTKHNPDHLLEDGRHDIASVFYPLIGPYDARDPAVLEYHILSAQACGIDAFVVDWYGPGAYSDSTFTELLRAAERLHFRVAACLEEKSFFPGYSQAKSRAEAMDEMERHVRRILEGHAPSAAYLRHMELPVLFMFIGHQEGALGRNMLQPEELRTVIDRFAEHPFLLARGHLDPAYLGIAHASYAWCGDRAYRKSHAEAAAAARAEERLRFWTGVASPGFDDTGVNGWGDGPRVTDRRGTTEYEENWKEILEWKPDYAQIVTWNDFEEGTTIEPSRQYQFQFVDLTEQFVGRWTGRSTQLGDNRWPYRLYEVRRKIGALADNAQRRALTDRADAWAADFAMGRRFGMIYTLSRLEKAVQ